MDTLSYALTKHAKTTELIAHLAQIQDVDVTEDDKQYWSMTLAVAKALDTIVDDDHDYDTQKYCNQLRNGGDIPYLSPIISAYFPTFFESITPEQKAAYDRASHLGECAIKRLEAKSAEDYISVVQDESKLMADVLQIKETGQPSRRRFNEWLKLFGQAAYMLDTTSDIIRDKREGNHNLPVNISTVITIGRVAARDTLELGRVTPLKAAVPVLHRGVTKVGEKIYRSNGLLAEL